MSGLESDLGAAWFEIGEFNSDNATGNKSDSKEAYAEAAEHFSNALIHPGDAASLLFYNRALCWERLGDSQNARKDMQTALASEKSSKWRAAIQAEIDRLSARSLLSDTHGAPISTLLNPTDPLHTQDELYEVGLARATEQLIQKWSKDPNARAEISEIARSGLQHKDRWLQDWIAATRTHPSQEGDVLLALAVHDGSTGSAKDALSESQNAADRYKAAGNLPGYIRAVLAETYALQRLDRARECLDTADSLERRPVISSYGWIRTQLTLEEGSCHLLSGDYADAKVSFDKASASSMRSGLDWLHLRAVGDQAEILQLRGSPVEALQIASEALMRCQYARCPPIREYLFTLIMARCAEILGLPHVAVEVMRTGEQLAHAAEDATAYAYALETLALLEGREGRYKESDSTFADALKAASSIKSLASIRLYSAEWQTDRAEILSLQGTPRAALDLLAQNENALLNSDYQHGRILFFNEKARALLALNNLNAALDTAQSAVLEAEKAWPTLHSVTEKEQWQRENAPAYAQLVKVYLQRNQSSDAFKTWTRYRALPYEFSATTLQKIRVSPASGPQNI